jgi:hypothetical protein
MCFRFRKEIVCVDTFAHNIINLTKKQCQYHLPAEEFRKTFEEIYQSGEELSIVMFERHRYSPRIYYRIYTIFLGENRYRTFMEVFDGTSANYEYVFCTSRRQCKQIMETREAGNKKLY